MEHESQKKSQSVGSGLYREGIFSCNVDIDDEIDLGLTSNNFEDGCFGRPANLYGSSGLQEGCGSDDAGANLLNKNQENAFGINIDPLSNGSTFFIADIKQFDDEFCQDGEDGSPYHGVASNHTSVPHTFSKSYSLPSLGIHGSSPVCRLMPHRSRSVENLCTQTIQTVYLDGLERQFPDIGKQHLVLICHNHQIQLGEECILKQI